MGYAFGLNNNGREIGYGVQAVCDLPDCAEKIDRGLYHCCGGIDGVDNGGMEDEPYCGGYFCGAHLAFGPWNMVDDVHRGHVHDAICPPCQERWERTHGAAIRNQAVENVDSRYGYTCEFSGNPEAHRQEYDAEEERLIYGND